MALWFLFSPVREFCSRITENYATGATIYNAINQRANVNLFKLDAETTTVNGITFQVDEATGSVFIEGGQTSISPAMLVLNTKYENFAGCVISGCPSGGSDTSYELRYVAVDVNDALHDYGTGINVEANDRTLRRLVIVIANGYTIPEGGLTFTPVVKYQSDLLLDKDSPYTRSMSQLTVDTKNTRGIGKNKLQLTTTSGTQNGISYTIDQKNGTVSLAAGGTASADTTIALNTATGFLTSGDTYILSGCPEDGSSSTYYLAAGSNYDYGEEVEFTASVSTTVSIVVKSGYTIPSGGLVFRPMIREVAYKYDPSFYPYIPTMEKISGDVMDMKEADYGAGVNLLTLNDGETDYGVTSTPNKIDGSLTLDGTCTGSPYTLSAGYADTSEKCIVSFTGANVPNFRYRIVAYSGDTQVGASGEIWYESSNSHLIDEFDDLTYDKLECEIIISNNTAFSNTKIYLMIRPASITDSTFYPHIKTNQQLQEDVAVFPENAKKNYFDYYAEGEGRAYGNATVSIDESTNRVTITGNWYYLFPVNLKKNTSYRFTGKLVSYTVNGDCAVYTYNGESLQSRIATFGDTFNTEDNNEFAVLLYGGNDTPGVSVFENVMIRPAGTSPDYVPYMRSNLELTHDTDGVRGVGRNILRMSSGNETYTATGLTFTKNYKDGSITINGTATETSSNGEAGVFYEGLSVSDVIGYIISGGESMPSGSTVYGRYADSSNNWVGEIGLDHNSPEGIINGRSNAVTFGVGFTWSSGVTFNNVVVKPMIRSAKYADDPTYYPYIKTNQQLQEDVAVLPENAKKNYFDARNLNTVPGVTFSVDSEDYVTSSPSDSDGRAWNYDNANWIFDLPAGTYILSAEAKVTPSSGATEIYCSDGTYFPIITHNELITTGRVFTLSSNKTIGILSKIFSGSLRFMLRPVGTSPDYVPYMRSNLELTHDTDGVRGVGRNYWGEDSAVSLTNEGTTGFGIGQTTGKIWGKTKMEHRIPAGNYIFSCDCSTITTLPSANFEIRGGNDSSFSSYCDANGTLISQSGNHVEYTFQPTFDVTHFTFYDNSSAPANLVLSNIMIRSAKYADDPTYYPYSENEIEFQSKLRPITVGTMYDADDNAAVHNAHPRGKNITDIFNAGELSGMISSGLFDEIYPGDYFNLPMGAVTDRWSARTFTCRVMHLNPMKYVGDSVTFNITSNHIGFATDESWFDCAWNESGTTAGGYAGSTIHTRINESAIITAWQNALSSKLTLMQARTMLTNAVNTEVDSAEYPGQKGMASGWAWSTSYFKLMSEIERYGAHIWSSGKGYNTGSSNYHLAYYANNAALRGNNRRTWEWLSDIVSVSFASDANSNGASGYNNVAVASNVRPLGFLK